MMDLFVQNFNWYFYSFFYLDGFLYLFQLTDFLELGTFPAGMITFTYLISYVQSVHFNFYSVAKLGIDS